ncbi:MFS transporter [Humibacter sp.]|uniref:MFS transporter n=1 Tax=Humibacter sp. TaxID=1940291 RepID=UPI002CDF1AEE|nr:MFS transporter [Humibacter sp.]HVX09376.1 MFS transporter [Humibacter sp.]
MSLREHLIDVRPLRDIPAFRAFWVGATVSSFGSQLSAFALLYYMWELSHSAALVGLIGLVRAVPMAIFGLMGGTLADRMNRRTVLLTVRLTQLASAVSLAVVVLAGGGSVPVVYVFMAIGGGLASIGAPVAQTFAPRLLDGERLTAGLALMRLSSQFAMLAGPFVAGFLVNWVGVGLCLVIDGVTFLASLWGIFSLPADAGRPQPDRADGRSGRGILGAVHYLVRTPVLLGAFAADLNATVLAMPTALFPVINAERFGGSPVTLGLMLPAIGLGGILAGVFSGRITRQPRQGVVMVVCCAVWGAGMALFGLGGWLPVALLGLVIAGAADTGTVVSRGTIVQRATPDALRGRMNALDFLVGAGGPSLGDLRAGLVASATSGAISAVSGGLACVIGAGVIGAAIPSLRSWRADASTRERDPQSPVEQNDPQSPIDR